MLVLHNNCWLKRLALPSAPIADHCRWLICCTLLALSALTQASDTLPLHKLTMPPGFAIKIYAEVENPRQLAIDTAGTLYAGSRRAGKVHAIRDTNHDQIADQITVVADRLVMPSGIAVHDNRLYIAAVDKIYQTELFDPTANAPKPLTLLYSGLPKDRHHGWKFIDFGPDDLLYIPVGAPCNVCLPDDPVYASIQTLDLRAKPLHLEPFALGVRNSVGFTWHPTSQVLWFTDNGRDHLGDDAPPCELNTAARRGLHFGFPFEHGDGLKDPEFGDQPHQHAFVSPALALGPHVAPLGVTFGEGLRFPEHYQQALFVAEHGSWNRSPAAGHTGYKITLVSPSNKGLTPDTFIEGWLENNKAWGRPADVLVHPDGSLLIADDLANVIYRVSYQPQSSH